MKVLKPINNNIVSAYDEGGQEIVVMGRGIGFKAKEGGDIPPQAVEKVFRMDNQNETDRLKALLSSLPVEHIRISNEIIAFADRVLRRRMNQSVHITLTDHISFAIMRFREGMVFSNALLTEVRRFYPQEFVVGEYALGLVERDLGIRFPIDEAASIALHIVNAEYDTSISEAVHITRLAESILQIVRGAFSGIDENSPYYDRFITHLKFLAQRIYKMEPLPKGDPRFGEVVSGLYPEEYLCGREVAGFVGGRFHYAITEEETAYLTLHIRRMRLPVEAEC